MVEGWIGIGEKECVEAARRCTEDLVVKIPNKKLSLKWEDPETGRKREDVGVWEPGKVISREDSA
eukprot:6213753-Pleurochrysis_carterae.AAC.5